MERKLRILWISNTPAASDETIGSNGTGGWLKSLDKAIQDKVELHVAFYDRRKNIDFEVGRTKYYTFSSPGIKGFVRKLRAYLGGESQFVDRWNRIIETVNPDIIHIHGTELGFVSIVKQAKVPVVLSIQAILQSMVFKYFGDFQLKDLGFFYWRTKYYKDFLHFRRMAGIERDCAHYLNYVIGRTEWDCRCYSVLAPQAKYFINNEVLRDGFYKACWREHAPENGRYIVHTTTGRLLFKGLETICYSLTLLQEAGMNVEWHVAGISECDEVVKIARRNLGNRFPSKGLVFLGPKAEEQLIDEMLKAHVFAYPTHQDNSSNALCEAMMLGMPCVSTFAGGSGTMLTDKVNGIMVQDGEPWVMAGAIKELLQNRSLALQYASQAKSDASARHNKEDIVNGLLEIYRHCAQ